MEMILALVAVIAVIIFGALISMGNERQRRAIDSLREHVILWAMQDLRIKREKQASQVRIDEPLAWLNNVTSKVVGYNLKLQTTEYFDSPITLVCTFGDKTGKAVLSPLSPNEIRKLKKERKNRLVQYSQSNPLYSISKGAAVYDISVLNAGIMFDLELQAVLEKISGQKFEQFNHLWLYMLE